MLIAIKFSKTICVELCTNLPSSYKFILSNLVLMKQFTENPYSKIHKKCLYGIFKVYKTCCFTDFKFMNEKLNYARFIIMSYWN